jgi:DNA-binding transcriptional regulator YhcF (GntR family)
MQMKNNEIRMVERLHTKSMEHTLLIELQQGFNLSPVEAKILLANVLEFRQEVQKERQDGQIIKYAVARDQSAGKTIEECKLVPVVLTMHSVDDLEIYDKHGTPMLRKTLVSRLAWEAYEQDALLSQEDLAQLIFVRRNTVRRIIAEYRKEGVVIPTRGMIKGIGRGVSHKTKIIEMYVLGYQFTDITQRMAHSEASVQRYLEAFTRVMLLKDKGLSFVTMRAVTGMSERLLREYLDLYEKYNMLEYKECLDNIRARYAPFKKRGA